jgi:hypothetical protein
MPARLNRAKTKKKERTEHTENREKRFTSRADIERPRFSPCRAVFLCELHVEFRDREYLEKLSKTAAIELSTQIEHALSRKSTGGTPAVPKLRPKLAAPSIRETNS